MTTLREYIPEASPAEVQPDSVPQVYTGYSHFDLVSEDIVAFLKNQHSDTNSQESGVVGNLDINTAMLMGRISCVAFGDIDTYDLRSAELPPIESLQLLRAVKMLGISMLHGFDLSAKALQLDGRDALSVADDVSTSIENLLKKRTQAILSKRAPERRQLIVLYGLDGTVSGETRHAQAKVIDTAKSLHGEAINTIITDGCYGLDGLSDQITTAYKNRRGQ
jgi:hypothetical protein